MPSNQKSLTDNLPIDSSLALRDWFHRSGVTDPLDVCIGPLPNTGISIARWSRRSPETRLQTVSSHYGYFRIAVILEPLESQIWTGGNSIWSGVIGANRFRICPPGGSSSWRQLSGCDIVNLFVPVTTIDRIHNDAQLPDDFGLSSTAFVPDRQVLDLVCKILESEASAGLLSLQYCDGLSSALLCYLLERYSRSNTSTLLGNALSGIKLRRVLNFISENVSREIPISEMAALCTMSESHFSRAFHASAGLPPHQYAMKIRLEHACKKLIETDESISNIAFSLGFSNASHFSRTFAQRFGIPPARYRQLHYTALI